MLPKLTLVLGGVSSGKSDFSENLILSSNLTPFYIATAEALDTEMQAKIARHRTERGAKWHTIETPLEAPAALDTLPAGVAVLLDCATMWLSNQMMADRDIEVETARLLAALGAAKSPVVVVSNEVGLGGIAGDPTARKFAAAQGRLNRDLAAISDHVILVAAGLPLYLKGAP